MRRIKNNLSYREKNLERRLNKMLNEGFLKKPGKNQVHFQKGSIDNIVNSLGLKNKTSIYRKEEGAVITNKTMKSINEGRGCSTSTYQKLLDKLKFQQGFDFHLEHSISNNPFIRVFTSSHPKSLYKEKKAEFMDKNNLKNNDDLTNFYWKEMYEEDIIEMSYEQSYWEEKERELSTHFGEEDLELIGCLDELKNKIEAAEKNLNITILGFNNKKLFDFMYQVESPNRFYDCLCAYNTNNHHNEWLLDNFRIVNLPKYEMSQADQLKLLKKYCPNNNIKIDQAYYKKVLHYSETAGLQKIIKNIIKLIEKTKNFNNQTASTNIKQLLEDNENEYENNFWINYFILKTHGLNIFFQQINVTCQIDEFGLPYENTLLDPNKYHAPEKDISFKTFQKFIFYISSCEDNWENKDNNVFIAPTLAYMPEGYINYQSIPRFHNEEPYLKSMTVDGYKIPSKDSYIKNLKKEYKKTFSELKNNLGNNVYKLAEVNEAYLKD